LAGEFEQKAAKSAKEEALCFFNRRSGGKELGACGFGSLRFCFFNRRKGGMELGLDSFYSLSGR
jgi:hypothetical protein